MIPKIGDIVDINPLFKKVYETYSHCSKASYGEEEDGHIHVVNVCMFRTVFEIKINSYGSSYRVDQNGCPTDFCSNLEPFGWPTDAPLFVPINQSATKTTNVMDSTDLKKANTKLSATVCASCGSKLKDPMMGPNYKHCPKCEP